MIIGHQAEEMRKAFARPGLEFIEQKEQLGTGHALMVARPELERCPSEVVVALVGDVPLLRPETLRALVAAHRKERAACTILTDATRIIPPATGASCARAGSACAPSWKKKWRARRRRGFAKSIPASSAFRARLAGALGRAFRENAQKEYLLTDLIEIFNRHHLKVGAFEAPAGEAWGINDRAQLARGGENAAPSQGRDLDEGGRDPHQSRGDVHR